MTSKTRQGSIAEVALRLLGYEKILLSRFICGLMMRREIEARTLALRILTEALMRKRSFASILFQAYADVSTYALASARTLVLTHVFLVVSHDSIRGYVRPSVRGSVGPSVRRSVTRFFLWRKTRKL